MSVLTLPEPAGWTTSRRRLAWTTVAGLAPALAGLLFSLRALVRGSYLTALVAFALAACFALVVLAVHSVRRGRTSPRVDHDSVATTILPNRRFTILVITSLLLAVLSMLVIAVAVPLGLLDLPLSPGLKAFSPFVAGFGALVGIAGLVTGWRRGGAGYVELSPDGVDIANIVYTESVDWDDIADVADAAETKKTRKAVVLKLHDGSEKVIDGADFYVPGGAPLYWMVTHYWRHPDARIELTDGRAVERLINGAFPTT